MEEKTTETVKKGNVKALPDRGVFGAVFWDWASCSSTAWAFPWASTTSPSW